MARIIDQQKKNLIGERVRFYRIQRGYSQQQCRQIGNLSGLHLQRVYFSH